MKGTDHFKRTIQMYLEQRAEEDTLFAQRSTATLPRT
ncbi:PcfK-like family protein [Bacteroides fragilis]|uniref:PcfK-like family protein n=1 Tax=Bacteroides fragilis TaxID=817 RepID=A0AAQ2NJ46_BACFG|nr:PcfK-like family protein [Bacteroides fragilis]